MNRQRNNDRKAIFLWGFLGLVMFLMGLGIAEMIDIDRGAEKISQINKETLDQVRPDKDTVQRYLSQYQDSAQQLARRNSFVPPVESGPPGDCLVIFGDEALFGTKWVKAGDRLGEAEVLEIGASTVTLWWNGEEITRSPVMVATDTKKNTGKKPTKNVTQSKDGKATDTWTQVIYDEQGKVAQKIVGSGSKSEIINFVYDDKGALAENVYPDGTRVLFDTAGNMTEKISPDGMVYNIQKQEVTTQGTTGVRIK